MTFEQQKSQLYADFAAVLMALGEMPSKSGPEGHIYTALGMDMGRYQMVRRVVVEQGFGRVSGYVMTLTPKGEELAAKLNEAAAEAVAAKK